MSNLSPIVHGPGEGEANAAFGLRRWFRVTGAHTSGAFAVFEEVIPEGEGPPLHIHHAEHELFTVLSGSVKFRCEGEEAVAGPGFIPPGAAHAFRGMGPGDARVSIMLTPGRGADFFKAVEAEGLTPPGDFERIKEIAKDFALEFVGPPID